MEDDWTLECPEICTRIIEYRQCDSGNGLTYAIWNLLKGDGLKDAICRSVYRIRDSLARACIPVVEENFAGECLSLSLRENRILGASVVRYSTGKSSLGWRGENELLSGPNPGFIVIKSTAIWSCSRLYSDLLGRWDLNLLSGRNPGFAISRFLSGRNPGFNSNLGHTIIRLTPGFLVIVQVNCYLVATQASQW